MEKIISEVKRKQAERNEAILAEFEEYMANGSDKTAVYEHLAEKYGLKRAASVYSIIKKALDKENPTKRKYKKVKK
ncbi:MAG: hypothetical protein IJ760_07750 [Bacteroidales bacterium]|nr:hypothetical protein [Bacteroidales bacterium]